MTLFTINFSQLKDIFRLENIRSIFQYHHITLTENYCRPRFSAQDKFVHYGTVENAKSVLCGL